MATTQTAAMMMKPQQPHQGGAVRIVLHSANQGVDEKAEVTVALNNPDMAVERMIETLAQRFPPESVMTIQPARGLMSGSSSGVTNSSSRESRFSSSDGSNRHGSPMLSMSPSIRDGMATLPPELTSCILANDPSLLPGLLGLAVSGDDPRRWANEVNFNPDTAATLVHHLAHNPEFYDWVSKLEQATHNSNRNRSGDKGKHSPSGKKKSSRDRKLESPHKNHMNNHGYTGTPATTSGDHGGSPTSTANKKNSIPLSLDSHGLPAGYRIRSDGIVTDPTGQPIFSLSPDGRLIGLDGKPLRPDQGAIVRPRDMVSTDSRSDVHRGNNGIRGNNPSNNYSTGPSHVYNPTYSTQDDTSPKHNTAGTRHTSSSTTPGVNRMGSGTRIPHELLPGFGEHVEVLDDGTRVRYVEVEVVEEKTIEIPRLEIREVEKVEKVQDVRQVEKIEYYPDIEWNERRVTVNQEEMVIKEVAIKKIVEVPREVIIHQEVIINQKKEKIIEIPQIIEVEKPYDVVNHISVPRYVNQEQQTVVAQKLKPIVRESKKVKNVKTKTYEPVLYAVDVYVPKAVSNVFEPLGKLKDSHRIVEVPAPQYNTLLDHMNKNLEHDALTDLYVRGPGGQVPVLPTGELAEIVPPMANAFPTRAKPEEKRNHHRSPHHKSEKKSHKKRH